MINRKKPYEKNPIDTSGSEGMQKLFLLGINNAKSEAEKINLFLKSGWQFKKMKESSYGLFILIEYIGLD